MYYYASSFFERIAMTLRERDAAVFFPTYARLPLEFDRGSGMHLWTRQGEPYLDMFSGVAVNALGHAHPEVVSAITRQAGRFIHVSNYYLQEPQIALAELLVKHSGYPRVFFANTGTESIEGAVKIARKWGSVRGKRRLLAMSNAFHGRTMGALSLMDRPKYREGFGPFLANCEVIEFNNPAALTTAVSSDTAAVIIEFIQGEGGIRPVSAEFAATLRHMQQHHDFLIIADEIQSGLGRTGRFFAFEHFGIRPDVVVLAKPIGGGLPLGAILGSDRVADVLQPGMHGTTFGGNPVACAAGVAVVTAIAEHGLMNNAHTMGILLRDGLASLQSAFPSRVREVRGLGLMVGMELASEGEPVVEAMRKRRILINCTDRTVLRFLPPLIVQKEHIQETVTALRDSMYEVYPAA
jgi:acetylornithine aminotransferase